MVAVFQSPRDATAGGIRDASIAATTRAITPVVRCGRGPGCLALLRPAWLRPVWLRPVLLHLALLRLVSWRLELLGQGLLDQGLLDLGLLDLELWRQASLDRATVPRVARAPISKA